MSVGNATMVSKRSELQQANKELKAIPHIDIPVIVERDRGGPVPWLISGTRYVPASFAIFNGILFAIIVYLMHIRDRREMAVRAAVA